MPYGITQCYLPPGRGDIPALYIQGGPKKFGHELMAIILSNLNLFSFFSLEDSLVNFCSKDVIKIPPRLAYLATPPY